MGKDRKFYGAPASPLPFTLSPKIPSLQQQERLVATLQKGGPSLASILQSGNQPNYGIYASATAGAPLQTAAELDHELAVKKARVACDFLERITMITREEKASYHSMLISKDQESNIIAITIITNKVGELTDLVQMYQAGIAHQPEIKK